MMDFAPWDLLQTARTVKCHAMSWGTGVALARQSENPNKASTLNPHPLQQHLGRSLVRPAGCVLLQASQSHILGLGVYYFIVCVCVCAGVCVCVYQYVYKD